MVSPSQKRRAAQKVVESWGLPIRRVCFAVGLGYSTYYYKRKIGEGTRRLIKRLHELARKYPRYGYRRTTALLKMEGWRVGKKRVQRLRRQEGLKVPQKQKKRRRGKSDGLPVKADHRNYVWSWDFVFDRMEDGGALKMMTLLDEYTKESLSILVDRSITSTRLISELERVMGLYGIPEFIRSDNGPEFIANALKRWLKENGIRTQTIEPGHPWENPYIESFNGKFRDECLNRNLFNSLFEARVVVEDYRKEYNTVRPHSSLGYMTPSAFARNFSQGGVPLPVIGMTG